MWEPLRLQLQQLPHLPCRHDNDDGGGDDDNDQLQRPDALLQLGALQPQDAQLLLVFLRLLERDDDGGALACDSSQQQQGDDVYGDGDELQHDDNRDGGDVVQKLYLCKWMPLLWGRKYTFS